MARRKSTSRAAVSDTPVSPSPDAKPDGTSGNLSTVPAVNAAIDAQSTAQERLDALTAQQADMQRRADQGLPPD